jgi:hypothetical protein
MVAFRGVVKQRFPHSQEEGSVDKGPVAALSELRARCDASDLVAHGGYPYADKLQAWATGTQSQELDQAEHGQYMSRAAQG